MESFFGPHEVDRFATFSNKQIKIYNSLLPQPDNPKIDAFIQKDWHFRNNWANPPFSLINKIV